MSREASHESTLPGAMQGWLSRLVARPLFWVLFIGLGLAIPIARSVRLSLPRPLPGLAPVPVFGIKDQNRQSFGNKELDGKVLGANAIFTRCPTICPVS